MNWKFWKNREVLTPEERKERKKERILLIISGILLGISFPPFPFPFQLFMVFGFIPYFLVIEKKQKLVDINRATYLTFFIFSVITLYWVGSWQDKTDPFLMISGVLLLFVNPIFILAASTLYYLTKKYLSVKAAIYLFPLFWVTYEYIYMLTDASFPWLTLGSGLSYFTTFIQAADIVGAVGLSLIIVYINIFLLKGISNYRFNKKQALIRLGTAAGIVLIILVYGLIKLNTFTLSNEKIKTGIIQPNIDPWDKWEGKGLDEIEELYYTLSQKAADEGAELLVWPETAYPVYLLGPGFYEEVDSIYSFIERNKLFLLTGMPDINYYEEGEEHPADAKYAETGKFHYTTYNSIMLFSPYSREIVKYGKMKLVPFGERVPFVDQLPFLGEWIKWGVGISGWNVGQDTVVFNLTGERGNGRDVKLNGLICYESIYPYFVTNFVEKGADIITIVTNDSWYGKSSGPYQHKEIAVLRAVENRKSVIRAANGGVSAIINPLGITVSETEMMTKDYITGDVVIQRGSTFFSEFPLLIPGLSSALSIWVLGISILKKFKSKLIDKKNG